VPHPARLHAARVQSLRPGPDRSPRVAAARPALALIALIALISLGLGLGLAPRAARAGEALYLTWNDCPAGGGVSNLAFACDTNNGENDLFVAFTMPQAANNVVAVEIVIDMQHSSLSLPDWWRLDPSGCRFDMNNPAISVAANFPGKTACQNMWQGASTPAIAQLADYIPGQPGGAASQARIKVTASVLPADARSLDGTSMYYAARIVLKNNRTVDTEVCAGCEGAACLVLNSILIGRLAGSTGGDYFLQTPGASDANWARWQGGGGADCSTVPVRSRAWGQLKGLYR
jgi:hypothetical protein